MWVLNPEWKPYKGVVHGLHHRIFTNEEEKAICDYIRKNYLEVGHYFNNQAFRRLAVDAYLEKHFDDDNVKDVQFSRNFISCFKKRNHISSRRARYKRRPIRTIQEIEDNWVQKIKNLAQSVPHDRILNADETSVRILPSNLLTWAEMGSDSISIVVDDSQKKMITAMATVSMSMTKLPLFLIAKGKTERVEANQLGDISYHMSVHSEDGWMTQETFETYLKWLRQQYYDDDKLYLIVDCYKVHTSSQSDEIAKALNIELMFIPPGMTDKYQPCDRTIFGCLKASTKSQISKIMFDDPGTKIGMKMAVQVFIWSWEHLNPDIICDAWSIYLND